MCITNIKHEGLGDKSAAATHTSTGEAAATLIWQGGEAARRAPDVLGNILPWLIATSHRAVRSEGGEATSRMGIPRTWLGNSLFARKR